MRACDKEDPCLERIQRTQLQARVWGRLKGEERGPKKLRGLSALFPPARHVNAPFGGDFLSPQGRKHRTHRGGGEGSHWGHR